MKKHLIYALLDPGTEDIRYVGRSSLWMGRPRYHVKHAWQKKQDGSWVSHLHVHSWIRSLGENRPDIRVLEEFDFTDDVSDRLNAAEVRWISELRLAGHRLTNLTEGGGGILGHRHTAEAKAKIGEAKNFLGKSHSEESRRLIGEASREAQRDGGFRRGIPHSPETRARLAATQLGSKRPGQSGVNHWTSRTGRAPNTGRSMTEEARARLSASMTGRSYPDRRDQRVRELNSGLEFDQAAKAAIHFGVSRSTVCRCVADGAERRGLRFSAA